ncbi:MAG TPA: pseudouridine synthase [Bacteroidales bacterium]|nr:pseudouridine synthase [Bacteroidales bacterium]HSA42306.1 pseudouridine synthase [Bacteroidales bacterium]
MRPPRKAGDKTGRKAGKQQGSSSGRSVKRKTGKEEQSRPYGGRAVKARETPKPKPAGEENSGTGNRRIRKGSWDKPEEKAYDSRRGERRSFKEGTTADRRREERPAREERTRTRTRQADSRDKPASYGRRRDERSADERGSYGRKRKDEQPGRKDERPVRRSRDEDSGRRTESPYPPREKKQRPPDSRSRGSEERPSRDGYRKRSEGAASGTGRRIRKTERPDQLDTRREGRKQGGSAAAKGDGLIRLNKFIADAGICSRREADTLIETGAVRVNGVIITQLGTKVSPNDKVQVGDQTLSRETLRYVLLNKPKGFITTVDDPEGRKTVMMLIRDACRERVYPVGRLDRNTTGVLLFTNDGELAKKLTHPKHAIRKVYHVVLDQPLRKKDLEQIEEGLELEDGPVKVDAIAYVGEGNDHRHLGVEIHSGKNRIVRRIFEHLGYTVGNLDRVIFAGLTKKDLPRGRWRLLTKEEVNFLRMLG